MIYAEEASCSKSAQYLDDDVWFISILLHFSNNVYQSRCNQPLCHKCRSVVLPAQQMVITALAPELAADAVGQKQLLVSAHAQLLQNHWRLTSPLAKIATKKQLAHAQQLR